MNSKKNSAGKYDVRKFEWLKAVETFVVLVIVIFILFRFVIGFSVVDGVSMQKTFMKGETVFYTRITGEAEEGEIVFVRIPSGEYYVKRVIAKGGDTVDLRDGVLYVNGEAETGDYIFGVTRPEDLVVSYPYTVPEGYLFLLGDNREESIDSRSFGAISEKEVRGRVVLFTGVRDGKRFLKKAQ